METCTRGFSYMPAEDKMLDLKYVESSELEGAWKSTMRERIKKQEQKIWDDFLEENDIIDNVCEDDRYQFLTQIPEPELHNFMEIEFEKAADESYAEEIVKHEEPVEETSRECQNDVQRVTFVPDDVMREEEEVFHIYENEKDDAVKDVQQLESSDSADTVRARCATNTGSGTSKSLEDMKCVIESSIYCAKVRDLRAKINETLQAMITSLETIDLSRLEPEEIKKMVKRSSEFCSRFNRIYMYQLQRQAQILTRKSNSVGPPHTQRQRILAQAASTHDAALQALQVFYKSFEQTWCVAESGAALRALAGALRAASEASRLAAGHSSCGLELYNDNMLNYCDNLETALVEHIARTTEIMAEQKSPKTKKGGKKSQTSARSRSGSDARLSMYSLDARFNLNPRKSKVLQPSVTRLLGSANQKKNQKKDANEVVKEKMKSPGVRRFPLRPPRGAALGDMDVSTMVESVDDYTCESSHISREQSPVERPSKSARTSGRRTKRQEKDKHENKKHADKKEQLPPSKQMEAMFMSALQAKPGIEVAPPEPRARENEFSEDNHDNSEVSKLLQKLCGEKPTPRGKRDRVSGAKNAQLHCVSGVSPRPPTTPQLLRILEETIQKKSPRLYSAKSSADNVDKHRLPLNLSEAVVTGMFQYRTRFVQHMLASAMYANCTIGKPWEMVGSISEKIVDDLIEDCVNQLKIRDLKQLRHRET